MKPDRHANQPKVHGADNHGTSPSLAERLSVFHNTILQALKELQPLVVLFSLTVAVTSLLNSAYFSLFAEALSPAIAPSAYRLWTGGLARATATKSWAASFVGWAAITLLIVAVVSPWFVLLTPAVWRAGLPIVIWAI